MSRKWRTVLRSWRTREENYVQVQEKRWLAGLPWRRWVNVPVYDMDGNYLKTSATDVEISRAIEAYLMKDGLAAARKDERRCHRLAKAHYVSSGLEVRRDPADFMW